MTALIPVRSGKSTQVSLTVLQDLLDRRAALAATRTTTSTKKGRVESAKRSFQADPLGTVVDIQNLAGGLADIFDAEIDLDSIPLDQDAIDRLSHEYLHLERLQAKLEALSTRYRELIFAHLDVTVPRVPGRPASQVPGKVEASGPDPHYIFERRGGNRANPSLDTDGLRSALPPHLAAQVFVTKHHPAVEAYEEDVFDQDAFEKLVNDGSIDLDLVARYLTPGDWRSPAFWKTLVDGED